MWKYENILYLFFYKSHTISKLIETREEHQKQKCIWAITTLMHFDKLPILTHWRQTMSSAFHYPTYQPIFQQDSTIIITKISIFL